jgi:hypothetical protein
MRRHEDANLKRWQAKARPRLNTLLKTQKADIIKLHNMLDEINSMLSGPLTSEDAYAVVDYFIETGWRK